MPDNDIRETNGPDLLNQVRIDLSRRRYDAEAVGEFSRRVRLYYQNGVSVAGMAPNFGLEGPSAKGSMHYWVTKARIDLDELVDCVA